MTNAEIERLLSALEEGPRPLAELLPGATRAEVRETADYLNGTGLAGVRTQGGVLVARLTAVGIAWLQRARKGLG
jgi:hypothetical protein